MSSEYLSPNLSDVDTETGEIKRKKKRLADIGQKVPDRSTKGHADGTLKKLEGQRFYVEQGVFPGDDEAKFDVGETRQFNMFKGLNNMQDFYQNQQEMMTLMSKYLSRSITVLRTLTDFLIDI